MVEAGRSKAKDKHAFVVTGNCLVTTPTVTVRTIRNVARVEVWVGLHEVEGN